MWQTLQQAAAPYLATFGAAVLSVGTVTGFAFWLFKLFGDRWLSNLFAERLAAFRHEQAKELEQLKFEIGKLLDRSTKLHQREFKVLPKAWKLLVKSYHTTRGVTASLQMYNDLSQMKSEQLDEFITDLPLQNWQKTELRQAADKNRYYQDAIFWQRMNKARAAAQKSATYQETNGIFMPAGMKEKFDQIERLGWAALIEEEINKSPHNVRSLLTDQDNFNKEGVALFKALEKEVQRRLWSAVVADDAQPQP